MSVINDVFQAVITLANATTPYSNVVIGSLPAANGISMAVSTGGAKSTHFDKGAIYTLDIVLNGKHSNQQTVSDTLNDIHHALTKALSYPKTSTYQIIDIETNGAPGYIGREDNQWLYGSGLTVKFYYK